MSNIDTLLDETMAASNGAIENTITLTVDEQGRNIVYDGELLLGVESDHRAERIYFRVPKNVGKTDVFDLSDPDVKIFINFTNAYNATYRYECTDKQEDGDFVTFSWLLTRNVTEKKGEVKFVICAQKIAEEPNNVIWEQELTAYGTGAESSEIITYTIPNNITSKNLSKLVVYCYTGTSYNSINTPSSGQFTLYVGDKAVFSNYPCHQTYNPGSGISTVNSELQTANSIGIQYLPYSSGGNGSSYYKLVLALEFEGTEVNYVIQNEWHTTPFTGKVLVGIESDDDTPEVIANETATVNQLITDVANLNTKVDNLVYTYTKAEIDMKVTDVQNSANECNDKINDLYTELAEGSIPVYQANKATLDSNGNHIVNTYAAKYEVTTIFDAPEGPFYAGLAHPNSPLVLAAEAIDITNGNTIDFMSGDKLKLYIEGSSYDYKSYQSGIIEFELCEVSGLQTGIIGRGCYVSTFDQYMIIGAEFSNGKLTMSVCLVGNYAYTYDNYNVSKSAVILTKVERLRKVTTN